MIPDKWCGLRKKHGTHNWVPHYSYTLVGCPGYPGRLRVFLNKIFGEPINDR